MNLIAITGDCEDGTGNVAGYPNATRASIHPNAPELCNSIDDDCDGLKDEGLSGLTFTGNVTFTNQAQLNSWPPCYTKITGKLFILNSGINNLSPLSNLSVVGGDVTIQNTSLTSLNGLQGLTTIGGNLKVFNNNSLSDCCAIEALLMGAGIGGTKTINNNLTNCNTVPQILSFCPIPFTGGGGYNLVATVPCSDCPIGWQGAASFEVGLFPNPTTGELTLEFTGATPQAGVVQVLDLLGRLLHTETLLPGNPVHEISIGELPAGVYFVKVMDGDVPVWGQKVVKQ